MSAIAQALQLSQPSVSKHLRVLRDVDLVRTRGAGRTRLYQTNANNIKPLRDWAATFERYWQHQLAQYQRGRGGQRTA